jgi:ribosomal protein S18 acetylase RimI-like enzyme
MQITEEDINQIASMHISPRVSDAGLRKPASEFRFFRDKVALFYAFDKDSIILTKNDKNEITGILIYTYNENLFNRFAGPMHLRFYVRLLKTAGGFYGCNFTKFFSAARSMLGKNNNSDVPKAESYGKIWVLLVMEEFRRQGIAGNLLKQCIFAMNKRNETLLRVTVKKTNTPAINAYKKMNFDIIGSCMESSGESYVMQLSLKDFQKKINGTGL